MSALAKKNKNNLKNAKNQNVN